MPSLKIPEQHRPGLVVLRTLSDEQVSSVIEALEQIPVTALAPKDIIAAAEPKLSGLPPGDVEPLIRALHSLYLVRALSDITVDEFVGDLADAIASSGNSDLVFAQGERDKFVQRMNVLMDVKQLAFLAKANALQRDHEHIFHDAKILTDLRPVFREPDEEPEAMVLGYTLKVVFHDGSRHREIYMVLDSEDVSRLRATIDRAEKKAASLKTLMKTKDLKQILSRDESE